MRQDAVEHRLSLHGLAVRVDNAVPFLDDDLTPLFAPFLTDGWPDGFVPVAGSILPYDLAEVGRHLSPAAVAISSPDDLLELHQDHERFWLVDDRWGITEINLLKGYFRSWVLPRSDIDAALCVDAAVTWPLAQLLRPRGLHLVPAAAVEKQGWGMLIVSPYGIVPELAALAREGWRVIGQRWTALRADAGGVELLHVPGWIEPRDPLRPGSTPPAASPRLDLAPTGSPRSASHAFCDTVVLVEPGRRATAGMDGVCPSAAPSALKRAWPIVELPPNRARFGVVPAALARQARVVSVQLSRHAEEFVFVAETLRDRSLAAGASAGGTARPSAVVSPHPSSAATADERPRVTVTVALPPTHRPVAA